MEQITLYYRHGASDKVYKASLTAKGDGYVVHFAYGRRGTTLQTGTKTAQPIGYPAAKRLFDQLIAEKTAKGYTPGEAGTPYQQTAKANAATGILPMLLSPIEPDEAARLTVDPGWCVQEKFDGRRMLLRKSADGVEGINRQGLRVALPEPIAEAARQLPGVFVFDGECLGDTLVVFDVLELNGTNLRPQPYRDRLFALVQIVPSFGGALRSPETAFDTAHKAELTHRLREENREGIVFKRLSAPYTEGRPASGGNARKLKFHETASFIVGKSNARRSVALLLFDGDRIVPAGNVTIPPNHDVPAIGAVVECRYLYAFRESGSIYQPVYLGVREDVPSAECTTAQLKYKAEPEAVAA